jgi:hypothetical protein
MFIAYAHLINVALARVMKSDQLRVLEWSSKTLSFLSVTFWKIIFVFETDEVIKYWTKLNNILIDYMIRKSWH